MDDFIEELLAKGYIKKDLNQDGVGDGIENEPGSSIMPNKNNPETMDLVVLSKRFSRNAGVVVKPLARYRGKKTNAVAIIARAAKASHASPTSALSPNTEPFKPTNCSVERFVNRSEPATIGQASARPPVKYSSVTLSDFFIPITIRYVKKATAPVAIIKVIIEIVFIFYSFAFCLR